MKTLYFHQVFATGGCMGFGIKPPDCLKSKYDYLNRKIRTRDLEWHETYDVQKILSFADSWNDFLFEDSQLISAEVFLQEFGQWVDMLYLDKDGSVYVCELKIGGKSKDTNGQAQRYIGELYRTNLNLEWVIKQTAKYQDRIRSKYSNKDTNRHMAAMNKFIKSNNITEVLLDYAKYVLIDETPDKRVLLAVENNNRVGYSIEVYSFELFTTQDWKIDDNEQFIKMNISEVNIEKVLSEA